jgi:hypothetical protein
VIDVEAEVTTALVFAFTRSATVDDETMLLVISKVLSPFTRLPSTSDPQEIIEGQIPSVDAGVNEYSYQLFAEALMLAAFTAVAPLGSYTVTVQFAVVVA